MKRRSLALSVIVLVAVQVLAFAAEYYKLTGVTRVDQDLYKTSDGLYIVTQYCYHYGYYQDAVLKWEGPYGSNKIIWDDESCQVKSVFKK